MEKDIKQEEVVSVSMLDESEDIIMKKIKDKKGKIFKIV